MIPLMVRLGFDADASLAAVAAVKPLLELYNASATATRRVASARAAELALRCLAQAEATLPVDSLVTAHLRRRAVHALTFQGVTADTIDTMAGPAGAMRMLGLFAAAWKTDERLVTSRGATSKRCAAAGAPGRCERPSLRSSRTL